MYTNCIEYLFIIFNSHTNYRQKPTIYTTSDKSKRSCFVFLARDAIVTTNYRDSVMMFVRLSETDVHCDHNLAQI